MPPDIGPQSNDVISALLCELHHTVRSWPMIADAMGIDTNTLDALRAKVRAGAPEGMIEPEYRHVLRMVHDEFCGEKGARTT